VLHHVTMSYDMDREKMVQVLRIGREKLSDKGTTSAAKRVDPLRSQTGLPRAEILERMKQVFAERTGAVPGELRPEELDAARELVATKFATKEWLHRVP
jgi:lipoate-protein ligase A